MRLLIGVVLLSILLSGQVHAQAVQPTAQSNPETGNPQIQPAPNLGAPTTSLQGTSGPQVLGTSINQQPGAGSLSVASTQQFGQTVPLASEDPLTQRSPEDVYGFKSNKKIVIAIAGVTLFLAFWAVYMAAKRKIT